MATKRTELNKLKEILNSDNPPSGDELAMIKRDINDLTIGISNIENLHSIIVKSENAIIAFEPEQFEQSVLLFL